MINILCIAVGGALGSVLRYESQRLLNTSFPSGTLAVNIIGGFLIGCLWAISFKGINEQWRMLLMTGFCGGFTTFSAFTLESVNLMINGKWAVVCIYLFVSIAGGLLATFAGYKIFS